MQYSLKEFLDPSNFKSYDTLKEKLNDVLGLNPSADNVAPVATTETVRQAVMPKKVEDESPFIEDDDDDLKQFKALAQS
jgi:hypothetical protein